MRIFLVLYLFISNLDFDIKTSSNTTVQIPDMPLCKLHRYIYSYYIYISVGSKILCLKTL